MAQSKDSSDEDIISGQLANFHMNAMDETDDYVYVSSSININ